jgi:hypothetical protein
MILLIISIVVCLLALIPAAMFASNLPVFRRIASPGGRGEGLGRVSILIPARDEEEAIGPCVEAALATQDAEVEVIVLDDGSQDGTAAVVDQIARRDPRVRLESAPALPPGWCGKQHACFALSRLARHDLLLFIDADVRLRPGAVAAAVGAMRATDADLVSGFPRQETGSFLEKLLIPLIHFVLLCYLPMRRMRSSPSPAYAAGCGQFFLARRTTYEKIDGHSAIRQSLHDGLKLPRAFRKAGFRTDLFDASYLADCRMYQGSAATWRGLAKNATEGMASPAAIIPWTVLLLGGQVLPPLLLMVLLDASDQRATASLPLALCAIATAAGYITRLVMALRLEHSWIGVVLHPLAVLLLVAVQWDALIRRTLGRPARWRGRDYPARADAMATQPHGS